MTPKQTREALQERLGPLNMLHRDQERKAIVDWLRGSGFPEHVARVASDLADDIERLGHYQPEHGGRLP